MIIAAQHKPGHPLPSNTDYQPTCAWPEKCYVQWGGSGVVLSADGNYRTAFFEAFPGDNAGGFLRGEGRTIADAEAACFRRYVKESACNHRWGRKKYLNGGAICYGCGAFKTVFKAVHVFGEWRKPISKDEAWMLSLPPIDPAADLDGRRRKHRRSLALRRTVFGEDTSAPLPQKLGGSP
ncbi:hypothetical protein AB8B21_05460 [Tardiphaga sp. 866_E4_N2_1]|uniref:hypothetical protein n=1 Tax=unclassified Tardiphaga TaxID=2631404 RepID=UPI003F20466C